MAASRSARAKPAKRSKKRSRNYAYHYGDVHVPYIKQEEPLKAECQHFLDCINEGTAPLTDGKQGLELIRILEASSQSLKLGGASVNLSGQNNGNNRMPPVPEPAKDCQLQLPESHSDRLSADREEQNTPYFPNKLHRQELVAYNKAT